MTSRKDRRVENLRWAGSHWAALKVKNLKVSQTASLLVIALLTVNFWTRRGFLDGLCDTYDAKHGEHTRGRPRRYPILQLTEPSRLPLPRTFQGRVDSLLRLSERVPERRDPHFHHCRRFRGIRFLDSQEHHWATSGQPALE